MALRRQLLVIIFLLTASSVTVGQQPSPNPDATSGVLPEVSYVQEWRGGAPPARFSITVDYSGKAVYRSEEVTDADTAPGDNYLLEWRVSELTRARIFDLSRQAQYFRRDFDFKKSKVAYTGTKTLTYKEGPDGKVSSTTYNYSDNPAIRELTAICQGISQTLEFGRHLQHRHRFDKLGLNAELRNMEEAEKSGGLYELQAVAQILGEIANDRTIMHIARQRAVRLLTLSAQQAKLSP